MATRLNVIPYVFLRMALVHPGRDTSMVEMFEIELRCLDVVSKVR